ncbi:MAG: C_GCAxxG_C_C family protein [Anaerolineae bacterium]|nr:C_GCAxxG_C_C family protein [Anaerolineae bacterium]
MSDDVSRIAELMQYGFCCSQVLVLMGLEAQGKENPDLVRAMQGLCGGIGTAGEMCGSLTGAACLLGLYAGRGLVTEMADRSLGLMLNEVVDWFEEEIGRCYDGIRCADILAGDPANQQLRCPGIVIDTWQKARDVLVANGYEVTR